VPFVRSGKLVFLSGHIAKRDGKVWVGQLGRDMTVATGKKAARAVGIDLLGTLHAAVGDLDKVERIVRLTSLVNSTPISPSTIWSPTAARSCSAKSSPTRARTRAAPTASPSCRSARASRSS
jgi:enamine deaminase RidA (YjgF/YER057c/UK114 family)